MPSHADFVYFETIIVYFERMLQNKNNFFYVTYSKVRKKPVTPLTPYHSLNQPCHASKLSHSDPCAA
jgi:hypothetical protein